MSLMHIGKLTKQRKGRKLAIETGKCNLIVIDPGIFDYLYIMYWLYFNNRSCVESVAIIVYA